MSRGGVGQGSPAGSNHQQLRALSKENLTFTERTLTARVGNLEAYGSMLGRIHRTYTNWFEVATRGVLLESYPIRVGFRVGGNAFLRDVRAMDAYSYNSARNLLGAILASIDYLPDGTTDYVYKLRERQSGITLKCGVGFGDPKILLSDEYGWLPVEGRMVIDVGGGVADSAIYFALRHAREVSAYEPQPLPFSLAKMNVEANDLETVISPHRQAVGSNEDLLHLAPALAEGEAPASTPEAGIETPQVSLKALTEGLRSEEAVLKLDCEGAEYDIVNHSTNDTLRAFTHIMMEYHYGARSLCRKLIDAGFGVRASRPRRLLFDPRPYWATGHLLAARDSPVVKS